MLQERTIQLATSAGAPIDRSNGEEFKLGASGGVFFDRVDGRGIFVRFDESPVLVPVYTGRSIDLPFKTLSLVHGPNFTGEVRLIAYEKGEGVFDAPRLGEDAIPGGALGRGYVQALSGRLAQCALYNPTASGVLAKVTQLHAWTNTASERVLSLHNAELPTVLTTKSWRDFRASGSPACTISVDNNAIAVAGTQVFGLRGSSSVEQVTASDLVIGPGQALVVGDAAFASGQLQAGFWWQEYV